MNRITYFLISLVMLCATSVARADNGAEETDRLNQYVQTLAEQEAMTNWVVANAPKGTTYEQAREIVSNAYAYGINHDIKPSLIIAMIKQESGFRPNARSPAGAKGLMQVIPYWHRDKLKGRNPYVIQTSIEVGVQVIKDCLTKHGQQNKALKCYSGGARDYPKKITRYQEQVAAYLSKAKFLADVTVAMSTTTDSPILQR